MARPSTTRTASAVVISTIVLQLYLFTPQCFALTPITSPQISADENGFTLSVPEGANVKINYVSSNGNVRTTRVLTEDDLAILTESIASKYDSLDQTKASVVSTTAAQQQLQDEISKIILLVGNLESKVNASSALDKEQSACHEQGLLWTTNGCSSVVSCGDTIDSSKISGGRVSASCNSKHFYNNTCKATCPTGYSGVDATFVCELTGVWESMTTVADCVNVNECQTDNKCSQLCIDLTGSYACDCNNGYALNKDGFTCDVISTNTTTFTLKGEGTDFIQYGPVQAGVRKLKLMVWGSGGQTGFRDGTLRALGGSGAYAEVTLAVNTGDTFFVVVGGPGKGVGIVEPVNDTISVIAQGYTHRYGGGLVGVFNKSALAPSYAIVVAGSGGSGGSSTNSGNGGDGGRVGETATGLVPLTARCIGQGAEATKGGKGMGLVGAGVLGGDGSLFLGGTPGNYGNGGGVGMFGGGGSGHCPNVCGCGGGGGSSYITADGESATIIDGGGSPSDRPGKVIVEPLLF